MARAQTPRAYRKAFCQRIRTIRESMSLTQSQIAERYGLSRPLWAKYEESTLLPHYLIEKLSEDSGFSVWYILTGKPDSRESASRKPDLK